MPYRDDNDALRARLEKVEAELRAARRRAGRPGVGVEDRGGRGPPAADGPTSSAVREHVLPFEISDEACVSIAELVSRRLGTRARHVGRAVVARGVFSLERANRRTRITMHIGTSADLREPVTLGGLVALLVLGLPLVAVLAALEQHGLTRAALHALWALPVVVVWGGWVARRAAARELERDREGVETTLALVIDLARASLAGSDAPAAPPLRYPRPIRSRLRSTDRK